MMKKILSAIVLAALCCGMFSCNEKPPQNYKIVKVLNDGKEEVEELVAPNDTVALNMYLDKLGKIIVEARACKVTTVTQQTDNNKQETLHRMRCRVSCIYR